MSISRETMDLIKFVAQSHVSDDMINASADVKRLLDGVIISHYGRFLGKRSTKYTIKHPLTWWDHFKERFFPNWLLVRYPCDYKIHEFDLVAIFPELTKRVVKERPVFDTSYYAYSTIDED